MPAVIDALGTDVLSYGNFLFTIYKSSVTARPVLDSSGRTTKWVDFDITVDRALVEPNFNVGDTTTDNVLSDMRVQLNKTGQRLEFEDKGYGSLTVNDPGGEVWDANYGPHPNLMEWNPSGNDQNAIVKWSCKTSIPQCGDAKFRFAIAEMNYTIDHTIDEDGFPKITTNGHIVIPATRLSDTAISDHVDVYRQEIQTQVPVGFQRVNQKYSFNEAKTQLNFSWDDVGLKSPLVNGCTQCKVTHKASSQGPAFAVWNHSLGGTINVPPQVDKSHALRVFLSIAAERMEAARNAIVANLNQLAQANRVVADAINGIFRAAGFGAQGLVIPVRVNPTIAVIPKFFSVSNDPLAHGSQFQFDWFVSLRQNIESCVANMGLWRPLIAGQQFEAWRQSMEKLNVTNVRGPHQMRWLPSDDAIIDLCVSGNIDPPANGEVAAQRQQAQGPRGAGGGSGPTTSNLPSANPDPSGALNRSLASLYSNAGDIDPVTGQPSLAMSLPNPEASWIAYENVLIYREPRGRYARHRPLSGTVTDPTVIVDAAGDAGDLGRIRNFTVATASKTVPDILQEIDAPFGVVTLKGGAIRLGACTPMPNLLTCRGAIAKRNRIVECIPNQVIGRMGDIPLVKTTWEIEFLLVAPPKGSLPVLSDPVMGIDGGELRT